MITNNKHIARGPWRRLLRSCIPAIAAGTMILSQGCDSLLLGTDVGVDPYGDASVSVSAGNTYGAWYPYSWRWDWPYTSGGNWPYNSGWWGPVYSPGPVIPPRPRPRPKPQFPKPPVNPPVFRPGTSGVNNGFRPGGTVVPGKFGPIAIPNHPININGSNPGPVILPQYRPGASSR